MKREITPSSVSDVIPFSYATSEWLENQPSRPLRGCILGEISKDGKWAWLANGPSLEVVSTETGERLGACYFGVESKSTQFSITCACELTSTSGSKLIIGLECGSQGGFLAVFDIKSSKIIRGITMPYQVMAVETVSPTGGANYSNHVLHKSLRYMYGVAAVGMVGCNLFLVDLCLDDEGLTNDAHPSSLQYIDPEDPDLQFKRAEAIMNHTHFCISLNDSTAYHGQFRYKATKANKTKTFNAVDVAVTSLKYVIQMQSIAAGYSFGGFHIWNLNKLTLDHASRYEWSQLSVTQFVYQEPENDPRNFCYLWVARGIPQLDLRQDKVTYIALHALMYSNRVCRPFIGNVYEDLHSCTVAFEFDLTCDPYCTEDTRTLGSRLLGFYALGEDNLQHHMDETLRDEGVESSTHSLMVVMWEAWSQESQTRSNGFIGIFDLNQWYQSQMPAAFSVNALTELCQYLGFFTLGEVMDRAAPDFMLNGQVDPRSVSLLQTTSYAEQHFFPSSLAFRICCLIETGVIHASYLGLQRQILADLKRVGPSVLLEPREAFNLCIFSGLLPRSLEMPTSNMSVQTYQREAVLTISLEHNMIDFIISCANEWSNREFSGMGCSVRFVLDWAWKKAGQIKTSLDRLCVPLYNCSGLQLDKAKIQFLHYSVTQLYQLTTLLQYLAAQTMPITDQGLRDLDTKLGIVSLIHMHYLVVLWFYKTGILPEQEELPEISDEEFAYPANLLKQTFIHRRQELQRIDSMIRGTDLLLIDGIISHIGEPLTALWEKDGGTGLYPPPSLYALLNIYLQDSVPLATKHRIVQYLFMDIAACFPEGKGIQLTNRFATFNTAFSMKMSIYKLTYAFWLLDHKDFEGAISVLLDPVINVTDIEPWQNTLIIKAFLYQNEARKALKYFVTRRPAMATPEDMQLRLSVLLANGLIAEAFKFQRENRDQNTANHLLEHFFLACQQKKKLRTLFQLPLNPVEEEALVHFLQESREPYAQEMLVMYYLQRSRFVQALTINDKLRSRVMADCDPSSRERSTIRNIIVDGYANVLPKVQQKLSHSEFHQHRAVPKNEILRPQPLSTVVKASNVQVTSQATLIRAVLDKVSETSVTQQKMDPFTPFRFGAQQKANTAVNADNIPFVCTPMTPRNRFQQKDAAELVYPNLLTREAELHESSMECRVSPSKRLRYMDVTPNKRRTPKYASAELMSILQTPPVRRKTPISRAQSTQKKTEEEFIAPQSILKVRQMGQIVVPPSSTVQVDVTAAADSTSEPNEERVESSTESEEADPEFELLPKQIRFELSDSALSSPSSEKEDDVHSDDVVMEEVVLEMAPRIIPRSLIKDTHEIAERVSKTSLMLRSAISSFPPQEMEVSSSPHSEFSFREPLIPQERATDTTLENISPVQLSVSPRRPLHHIADVPVVFAPPVEVQEPDSSVQSPIRIPARQMTAPTPTPRQSLSKYQSPASHSPISKRTSVERSFVLTSSEQGIVTREASSFLDTTDDEITFKVSSPLSASTDDDMLHLELENSDSVVCGKEAEPPVANTVLPDAGATISATTSSVTSSGYKIRKSDLEQPPSFVLQDLPPKERTPESERRRSLSQDNSLSFSKFVTPESVKSSPVGSLQTAHSRLSSESSASSLHSSSLDAVTPPLNKSLVCETEQNITASDVEVKEVMTGFSTVSSTGSPKSAAGCTSIESMVIPLVTEVSRTESSNSRGSTISLEGVQASPTGNRPSMEATVTPESIHASPAGSQTSIAATFTSEPIHASPRESFTSRRSTISPDGIQASPVGSRTSGEATVTPESIQSSPTGSLTSKGSTISRDAIQASPTTSCISRESNNSSQVNQPSPTISRTSRESTISPQAKSHPSPVHSQTVSSSNGTPGSLSQPSSPTTESVRVRLRSATSSSSPISLRSQRSVSQSPSVSIRASTPEDSPVSIASKGSPSLVPRVNPPSPVMPSLKETDSTTSSTRSSIQGITPLASADISPVSSTSDLKLVSVEPTNEKPGSPLSHQDESKIIMRINASPLQLRPRSRNRTSSTKDATLVTPETKELQQSLEKIKNQKHDIEAEKSADEQMETELPITSAKSSSSKPKKVVSAEYSDYRKHRRKSERQKKVTDTEESEPMEAEASTIPENLAVPMEIATLETPKKRSSKSSATRGSVERSTRQTPRLIAVTAPKPKTVSSKTKVKLRTSSPEVKLKSRTATTRTPSPQIEDLPKKLTDSPAALRRTARSSPAVHSVGTPVHAYNTRLQSRSPDSITSSPGSKDSDKLVTKATPEKKKLPEPKEKSSVKPGHRPLTRAIASSSQKKLVVSTPSHEPLVHPKIEFSFSPPTAVLAEGALDDIPMTPVDSKPFIFSPPLTRARSRRGKRLSETDSTIGESAPAASTDPNTGKKSSGRIAGKKSVTRSRRLMPSPEAVGSDSPINFISPPALDITDKSSISTRRSQRTSLAGGARRRQSAFGHTRKKANLW